MSSKAWREAHPERVKAWEARYRLKKFGRPKPRPPIPTDIADLAWTAGIFDGEGSIQIYRQGRNGRYSLYVTVGNTDLAMVLTLKRLWAGHVSTRRKVTPTTRRPIHTWAAYSLRAEEVLRAVLPYLVTKRTQAEVALEFRAQVNHTDPNVGCDYRGRLIELRKPAA